MDKNFIKIFVTLSAFLSLTLTSCSQTVKYLTPDDPGTATIKIFKDNNSTSKNQQKDPNRNGSDLFSVAYMRKSRSVPARFVCIFADKKKDT